MTDPPDRISVDRDTTFSFMLEAQRRGHRVAYTRREWMWHESGTTFARWAEATVAREAPPKHISLGDFQDGPVEDHQVVFVRSDPPFNMDYIQLTWMLDVVDRDKTLIINEPEGIRNASEKLYVLRFPDLTPATLITREVPRLEAFMEKQGGAIVIKPVDLMGGYGVFVVRQDDPNKGALLESATQEGRTQIVAQAYLEDAPKGDKRILIVNGEAIGGVLRVPPDTPGEHRGNIHVGARTVATELTDRDLEICRAIAPALKEDGLYFTGIDVIGGMLTEVNVTSPTGVQEVHRLCGIDVTAKVIDFAEEKMPG